MGTEWISKRLAGEGAPIIIDGGMGTELEKTGVPMNKACWSGMAVLDAPDVVRKVHTEFLRAGAEVIIANTFSSGRHMLDPAGAGEHVEAINRNAVKLAREAIDEAGNDTTAVAGSMCEWSSARGDTDSKWSDPAAISDSLREQATLLAEAGVDLIAIEMAQHPVLTPLAIDAATATGLPVWLGVSCQTPKDGDHLCTFDDVELDFGSTAQTIVRHAIASDSVKLINIMHTPVPDVPQATEVIRSLWDGPIGVYPESGFFTMPNWQFVDVIEPNELVDEARSWVSEKGVRLLGGCCGLGPKHVAALRDAFQ